MAVLLSKGSEDELTGGKNQERRWTNGTRVNEAIARSRRSLWPPDETVEPKNEGVYFHRAKWHLHYRPAENRAPSGAGIQFYPGDGGKWGEDPLCWDQEAGP